MTVHIVGVRLIVALADFLIQRLGFCSLEFTETLEGQNLSGGATCRAKRANIFRTSESEVNLVESIELNYEIEIR